MSVRGGSGLTTTTLSATISGAAISTFGNWTTALSGATMDLVALAVQVKQISATSNDRKVWEVGYGTEGNEVPVTFSDTLNPSTQNGYDLKPCVLPGYIASGNRMAVRCKYLDAAAGGAGTQQAQVVWMPANYT